MLATLFLYSYLYVQYLVEISYLLFVFHLFLLINSALADFQSLSVTVHVITVIKMLHVITVIKMLHRRSRLELSPRIRTVRST